MNIWHVYITINVQGLCWCIENRLGKCKEWEIMMNYTRWKCSAWKWESGEYAEKMECKINTSAHTHTHNDDELDWRAYDANTLQFKSVILLRFSFSLIYSLSHSLASFYCDSMARKLFDFPQSHSKKNPRCLAPGRRTFRISHISTLAQSPPSLSLLLSVNTFALYLNIICWWIKTQFRSFASATMH